MQGLQLKPTVGAFSSSKSSFRGVTAAFQRLSIAQQPAARQQLVVEGEAQPLAGLPGRLAGAAVGYIGHHAASDAQCVAGGTCGPAPCGRGLQALYCCSARSQAPLLSGLGLGASACRMLPCFAPHCRRHLTCPPPPSPRAPLPAASRVCDLTGKRANNGYVVTFSHKRNKKLQQVNLQYKKVYWPEGQRCAAPAEPTVLLAYAAGHAAAAGGGAGWRGSTWIWGQPGAFQRQAEQQSGSDDGLGAARRGCGAPGLAVGPAPAATAGRQASRAGQPGSAAEPKQHGTHFGATGLCCAHWLPPPPGCVPLAPLPRPHPAPPLPLCALAVLPRRWVKLRISTKAIKSIEKKGLQTMADEAGIDLWKLPFEDARPARKEWLAANEHNPPMAKKPRAMKNADKLAASKKTPLVARYVHGKIAYVRSEQ